MNLLILRNSLLWAVILFMIFILAFTVKHFKEFYQNINRIDTKRGRIMLNVVFVLAPIVYSINIVLLIQAAIGMFDKI